MQLQGVPTKLFYSFETDRCTLQLRVGRKTYQLYATGTVGQRLLRQVRTDTSGIVVTLSSHTVDEIIDFSIIL